jgi:hypothetical protein
MLLRIMPGPGAKDKHQITGAAPQITGDDLSLTFRLALTTLWPAFKKA